MYFFDPRYFIFVGPAFLLALFAQFMVKHAFSKYSKVRASSGMSGAEAATEMLHRGGLSNVSVQRISGFLSDHYDPRAKVLRLSPEVYDGRSLASVGVACHEAGHALQDSTHYAPLVMRNAIVPMASIGSNLSYVLIFLGMILNFMNLAVVGLVLFSTVIVFQIVNLPVEFNASARAKQMLPQMGIISGAQESAGVASVLNAAALTYVAGTITSLMTLLYYAYIIFGNRRN